MSLAALYLCLLSGLAVAMQYDPDHGYYSVTSLEILAPYGRLWRSLHFYSGQFFFMAGAAHFMAMVMERAHERLSAGLWLRLVAAMAAALLLLFTGYILRADATGNAAGMIAENITLSIPVLGPTCNAVLFSIVETGLRRVYVNHLAGLCLAWLFLAWSHLRRYRVGPLAAPWTLTALVIAAAVAAAPLEQEHMGVFHIAGPWFFVGVQELLRSLPPLVAGVLFPGGFALALGLLVWPRCRRPAALAALAWLAAYAVLTFIGLSR